MRAAALVIALSAFAIACGGNHGKSICDNQVPPPAACMQMCNPSPSAPNTCPSGYHCAPDGYCDALCTAAGNECGAGYHCTPDGRCKGDNECTGLECQIVQCSKQGKPDTTIKGTVFAPNGTLPLYGIHVYVPNEALPPFTDGASCDRCNDSLPGAPVVQATTDEAGNFTLVGAPSGANIPLVIASGKWRRQIKVAAVADCTDNTVPTTDTRLPKNKSEGDIPKIALSTGSADTLECLLRRLGIDDSEIGVAGTDKRINLFSDGGAGGGTGASHFAAGFAGGAGNFPDSTTLWDTFDTLKGYDIVILSCEGGQHQETKSKAAMDALKMYADVGGRVFMSHWHNIWIGGNFTNSNGQSGGNPKPAVWDTIATWQNQSDPGNGTIDIIDEVNNAKGASFATWMLNVMGSTTRDQIPIQDGTAKTTCSTVDNAKAERWTYLNGTQRPQNFQFTAPNEAAADQRCGKVVFSDMHVAGNGAQNSEYPTQCGDAAMPRALTPQEKALAFMLFDLASCVGVLL